jgi:hypothetical protein
MLTGTIRLLRGVLVLKFQTNVGSSHGSTSQISTRKTQTWNLLCEEENGRRPMQKYTGSTLPRPQRVGQAGSRLLRRFEPLPTSLLAGNLRQDEWDETSKDFTQAHCHFCVQGESTYCNELGGVINYSRRRC